MKKQIVIWIAGASLFATQATFAGNKDRSGQGAAAELLVNPWAASGGLFGLNGANISGLEAMKINIAGISDIKNMEFGAVHNTYIRNSGTSIIDAGLVSKVGKKGTIGANLMSVNYGEIPTTTEGSIIPGVSNVVYKPSFFNVSLGYVYSFTKNINAGMNFTFVQEGIPNVKANAMGIDFGVKYTTGNNDNMHFGVTLRNVGTNIRFSGDGLSFSAASPDDPTKYLTYQQRSEKFQLPTQLNIAVANDFYLGKRKIINVKPTNPTDPTATETVVPMADENGKTVSRLTAVASFISNSFTNDYLGAGLEYAYKEQFFVRGAYRYETNINDAALRTTLYRGIAAGAGVQFELNASTKLAIDYAYKPTVFGTGVHTVGVRVIR